ncbi:hypothetical protein [Lactobacillus sp. CBA3605] [Lactiplantibacillus mudanjiangensis]|uniref:DUF998 domain-containing protein n=1 Tax=Lactiplantibacillus mudanjiangensis TaxID=1296538 RepID=UPI00101546A4|nr:DUF998 domain-containing protein [Lactiplantibacillus mudanjiangensis]VDG19517.1 hypothetical protein [Lactobacillus sp. CBA3605] [Lactiplantibacillus mudanjiangensis]VDG30967.1 hypothetical protein [Lactobacillus sp. CBA3605] [Lactiplantibacillus mudanjiangensis]
METETKDLHLTIPAEIGEQLQLKDQTSAKLIVRRGRLVIQFEESRLTIFQKGVLAWPVVMALLVSIGYYFFCGWQHNNYVKLTGDYSLATSIIIVGVIMGILLFAGFFIRDRHNPHNQFVQNVYWRNFPVIVLSFALILALVLIGGMWLLGMMFKGAVFDRFTASIILFVFGVVTNIAMVYLALIVDASILSTVLILVIMSGVAISMAVNNQRYWWQHNLSFLGTSNASSGWQFNATLIFAALLTIALVDYLFVSLQRQFPKSRRLWVLRGLLTLTAVDLGLVGVFPNNANSHEIHDQFAMFLVYLIIGLIVGVRWLLPQVTKDFLYLSYGVGVALVIAEILFQIVGYFSLTAFEIVAFVLAFGWLLMLLERIENLIDEGIDSKLTL